MQSSITCACCVAFYVHCFIVIVEINSFSGRERILKIDYDLRKLP